MLVYFCVYVSVMRLRSPTTYEVIRSESLKLKTNDVNETIGNVLDYVANNVSYKFYWYPRHIIDIWNTKEGDCTDQATLMLYMLETIYYKNYSMQFRYAHGYCDGYKHDWLRLNDKIDIDNFDCSKRVYRGFGVW